MTSPHLVPAARLRLDETRLCDGLEPQIWSEAMKGSGELVIAHGSQEMGPGNPGNKSYSFAIWSLEAVVASKEIDDDFRSR